MRVCMAKQFARRLGCGIRRDRMNYRVVFRKRHLAVDPVNTGRRAENKVRHFIVTGQLQQVQRSVDVRFSIKLRLRKRRPDACAGSKMNYLVERSFIEYCAKVFGRANVCSDKAVVAWGADSSKIRLFYIGRIKIVQIVDDRYVPSAFTQKMRSQMRADKSGPAGDQYAFVHN